MVCRKIVFALLIFFGLVGSATATREYAVGEHFSDQLRSGGTGPEMVVIGSGRFILGGWPVGRTELGLIKIDYLLAMGVTEVTRRQYRQFLTAARSGNLKKFPKGGDDLPVTGVSWDEAEAYVNWLSRETGHVYRLLSEAEWQSLASKVPGSDPCRVANIADRSVGGRDSFSCNDGYANTAPVGSFVALASGPYDIDGNVREWVEDCANESHAGHPGNQRARLTGDCSERLAK